MAWGGVSSVISMCQALCLIPSSNTNWIKFPFWIRIPICNWKYLCWHWLQSQAAADRLSERQEWLHPQIVSHHLVFINVWLRASWFSFCLPHTTPSPPFDVVSTPLGPSFCSSLVIWLDTFCSFLTCLWGLCRALPCQLGTLLPAPALSRQAVHLPGWSV